MNESSNLQVMSPSKSPLPAGDSTEQNFFSRDGFLPDEHMEASEDPRVHQEDTAGETTPPHNNPHTYAVPDTPNGGEPLIADHHYIAGVHSDSDQRTPEQPQSSEHYSWQALGEDQTVEYLKEDADQEQQQSQGTMLPFFDYFRGSKEEAQPPAQLQSQSLLAEVHGEVEEDPRSIIQATDEDREQCRMIGQPLEEDEHTIEPYDEAVQGSLSRTRQIDLIQCSIIEDEDQLMSLSYTAAQAQFEKSRRKKEKRSKSAEPPRQKEMTADEKMDFLLEEQKMEALKLEQERIQFVLDQQRNQPHPLDQAVNPKEIALQYAEEEKGAQTT